MVPLIGGTVHGGAVHGGTVLPGGCGPAWIWCLQLEARFRAGAVNGGAVPGTARGRERGISKNSLLAWMTRAGAGGVIGGGLGGTGPRGAALGERRRGAGNGAWKNGVWGCGVGVRGTGPGRTGSGGAASGCGERGLEERGLGVRRRGAGNGAWKNGVWGCGVGVRGTGPGRTGSGGAASGCGERERKAEAEAGYPSKDAGKLKRDGAARKQGMRGVGAAKGDAGEMLQEGKLRS